MGTKYMQTSAYANELPTTRDKKQQSDIFTILYLLINSLLKTYFSSYIGKNLQDLAYQLQWTRIKARPCSTFFPLTPALFNPNMGEPTGNDAVLLNTTYGLKIFAFQFLDDYGSLSVHGPASSTETVSCVLQPISVTITAAPLLPASPAFSKLQEGSYGLLILPVLRNCLQCH